MLARFFPLPAGLAARLRSGVAAAMLFAFAAAGLAASSAPVVGPGATKEEIINAYGWPSGQSQAGTKEILTYPQGRITLENGRVEKMDFLPNVPWPTPRPRPAPPSPTSAKKAEPPPDFWLMNFEDAQKEAARRHVRILILFIGSDWSPPSKQFMDEVAFHPDFVNAFTANFVFLRLDFPTRTELPPELREQNNRLRAKYEVTTYPALIVVSPVGSLVARIDLTKEQPGDNYRARVIAAVREVRNLLVAQPPPSESPPAPVPADKPAEENNVGAASMTRGFTLVIGALAAGLALVGIAWWFLWRERGAAGEARTTSMAERISDAASGLPLPSEMAAWSREKLSAVVASVAEADDYEANQRSGGDGDLALSRRGDDKPCVVVYCQPGAAGAVSAKRVKELFGTITLEGIERGWFVAPMGFSHEAREYAAERQIMLIDSEQLLAQMRALSPIVLRKILAQVT